MVKLYRECFFYGLAPFIAGRMLPTGPMKDAFMLFVIPVVVMVLILFLHPDLRKTETFPYFRTPSKL